MVPDEWIEHIHSSGRRLLALINDILDLTKVEAGKMELRLEPVELDEAVRDILAALTPVADKKHLRLVADVPTGLTIHADRMRFRQIIDNLLSNALKFTPEGGTITVTAAEVGHIATISVADTGAGIAPDDLDRVFAEFQQVGDVAAQKAGTGLGLALTQRLVQAHGGKVELTSEVGVGSTFTIHLPVAPDTAEDADLPEVHDTAHARMGGILVIEDEAGAARLLRTYLEDAGYRVSLATTGEAGLAAAWRSAPQAIILDVLLPDIDGWAVLEQLKAKNRTRDIPVVIVTVVDERSKGMALGAADYLVKPIDRDELLDRIARHVLIPPSVSPTSRILVIDDDPGTLQIVETNLRRQGYEVRSAASGVEGLRLARADRFDLIICDLLMPDMDGYAVVAALGSDTRADRAPIVVFTALDLSDVDRARLRPHVAAIVRKSDAAQIGLREWLAWMANQPDRPGVPEPSR
jgi:DNA-binding response OmpR family regulator